MSFVRNIIQAGQYPEVLGASADAGGGAQQGATRFHLEKHHGSPYTLDTWSEKYLPDRDASAPES